MFENVDTYIIFDKINRFYFSKIKTSFGCIIINKNDKFFITDSRYATYAKNKLTDIKVVISDNDNMYKEINNVFISLNSKKIGYEDKTILFKDLYNIKKIYPNAEYIPISNELEINFSIKNSDQIYFIQSAQKILEKALLESFNYIKAGITEIELANRIEFECKKLGAEKMSFDSIIAFGINSAMPHHIPTNSKLKKGDIIQFDIGCMVGGYCCDMSRVFEFGEADEQLKSIYRIVYEAQFRVLENINSNMSLSEIDSFAREFIFSKGYNLIHALGHGIGANVHEYPSIRPNVNIKIEEGMVITIEPGIYIEGVGGIRIEDMVYIKNDEIINLTTFKKPKELVSI